VTITTQSGANASAPAGSRPTPSNMPRPNLGRNTAMNFAGRLLPLIAGVGLIPFIAKGLGLDRFGLLGIVWIIFGYLSLFDFGLGRATTKFLAAWLAKGEVHLISEMVWTSVVIQILLGAASGLILFGSTPLLVSRILKTPINLVGEARMTFFILAGTLPVVLATSGLRAVLEGCQRFDISNLLQIPSSILVFVIPAVAIPFGLRLPGIVFLLAISRLIFALAHFAYCVRVLPSMKIRPLFRIKVIIPLISYGGWITVANFVNPVLVSLDRLFIGSILSVAMVGYYTAPFEAITKLWVIPASLATTIFPACSALGTDRMKELDILYTRSIKYLFWVLAPITLVVYLFARQFIQLWLGADFVGKSAVVLQILAIGVFINCFAHIPYCFVQGLGRPDATAKLFLCELIPYAAFAWWMIRNHGIVGAATAWSIRAAIEVVLLILIVWQIYGLSPRRIVDRGMLIGLLALCSLGAAMIGTNMALRDSIVMAASLNCVWLAAFALAVWKYVFDDSDRWSVMTLLSPLLNAIRNRSVA
jgi:O-antigen/teichoic acid export membrane protein